MQDPSFPLHCRLEGHERGISDLAWSPDSALLASASDDCTVRIWRLPPSAGSNNAVEPVLVLRGHSNYVFCVGFHPSGNILASGSFDESVRLWDVTTGGLLRTIPAHSDPVTSVSFSPDGTLLATASYDGLMYMCRFLSYPYPCGRRLWDTGTGRCLKTLVDNDNPPVTSAVFAPNGKYLLVATLDSTVRLWAHQTGRCVKAYSGHQNGRYCCFPAFVAGGLVASGSEDGKLLLWDMNTKQVRCAQQVHEGPLLALGVSPDGRLLATATLEPDTRLAISRIATSE